MIHTVGSLLLSLSCSGALMIILICAVSYIFRKKSSFQWQYYIWLFVIARLLLPFAPEGNLMESLGEKFEVQMQLFQTKDQKIIKDNTVYKEDGTKDAQGTKDKSQNLDSADNAHKPEIANQKSNSIDGKKNTENTDQNSSSIDDKKNTKNTDQNSGSIDDRKNTKSTDQKSNFSDAAVTWKTAVITHLGNIFQKLESAQKYLLIFWLIVAAFLMIRKITIYQCFVRYIRAGSTPISDINSLEVLSGAEQELGIKKVLELWSNPMVSSPMLVGIIHPCIVLPESTLSEKSFRYTILHELTHYKRRDLIYKWLGQLVLCIHWFNPLVYVMFANIDRLCELSCDEAVNKCLSSDEKRREYAETLLEAMKTGGNYREHLASITFTLSENKKMLKERLEAIMNYEKMTTKKKLLAAVLTAGIFTSALYAGSYTANAADNIKSGTVIQPAPETADNGIANPQIIVQDVLKTSAKSKSKLITKSKTTTSATSKSKTKKTDKSKATTSATSKSKAADKSKITTSATSKSKAADKSKTKSSVGSKSKAADKSKTKTSAASKSKTDAEPKTSKPAVSLSSSRTLKGAKKQKSDKITAAQADKMALALTKTIWVWDWIAFYVPYMSDAGVKKLLPASKQADWAGSVDFTTGKKIKFTQKKIDSARKKKTSKSLTRKDIDKHALMIMQSNGNWDCISAMLPYMNHSGIDAVVRCYNSKQFGNKKHAEDYY